MVASFSAVQLIVFCLVKFLPLYVETVKLFLGSTLGVLHPQYVFPWRFIQRRHLAFALAVL